MPSCNLIEKDGILSDLFNKGLIGSYKYHSAYEKVGLAFVEEQLEPAIDDIFRNFWAIM